MSEFRTIEQCRVSAEECFGLPFLSSSNTFRKDRDRVCEWFKRHAGILERALRAKFPGVSIFVLLMGSYRWKTNHLMSDMDAVIVTDYDHVEIMKALKEFYDEFYPKIASVSFTTKAGLPLFIMGLFTHPELGDKKLEFTIQSVETNKKIVAETEKRMEAEFPSSELLHAYITGMMRASLDNDEDKKLELKKWARVL
jgi:hypothetical protein